MELEVARKRVCDVLDAPRSTIYAREAGAVKDETGVVIALPKRGPRTDISDDELLVLIREVIDESPFSGEGHRKVAAYLRRKKKLYVSRKRVLRIMRPNGLLAPQMDKKRRKARPHDGTLIPEPVQAVRTRHRPRCEGPGVRIRLWTLPVAESFR